jgi:hypothetical protein
MVAIVNHFISGFFKECFEQAKKVGQILFEL